MSYDREHRESGGSDQIRHGPERYKFNAEEIRVLKECNRESFYYRCLPLGTFLGVGAFYAVRAGYLKPSARFGAGPKMFVGSVLGYFLGKMSYQKKCAEKLMQLPNSPLAEILRKQKGRLGFQESLSLEPGFVTAAVPIGGPAFPESDFGAENPGNFTDVGDTRPMTSFDIDSSKFTGMDDGQYDTTKQMLDDDNLPQRRSQQYTTSYDELRRQNREEYEHKIHPPPGPRVGGSISNEPFTQQSNTGSGYGSSYQYQYPGRQRRDEASMETSKAEKNIYGDVWDDKTQ